MPIPVPAATALTWPPPGYVHLLPANRKHSQNPGDDKAMVAARSDFLDRGYYAPLRDALCKLALRSAGDRPAPALLDSGCGEGYYTAGLHNALTHSGGSPEQPASISPNSPCAVRPSGFPRGSSP